MRAGLLLSLRRAGVVALAAGKGSTSLQVGVLEDVNVLKQACLPCLAAMNTASSITKSSM